MPQSIPYSRMTSTMIHFRGHSWQISRHKASMMLLTLIMILRVVISMNKNFSRGNSHLYILFWFPTNRKGRELVKEFEGDARSIILKLHHYHTKSNVAQHDIIALTTEITNLTLNDSWKGTVRQFLSHFKEKLRLLDSLVPFLIRFLKPQDSHFFRELSSKTMTSDRYMSWTLCGGSKLTPQRP